MHGLAAAALVNPWLSGSFCSAIEVHVTPSGCLFPVDSHGLVPGFWNCRQHTHDRGPTLYDMVAVIPPRPPISGCSEHPSFHKMLKPELFDVFGWMSLGHVTAGEEPGTWPWTLTEVCMCGRGGHLWQPAAAAHLGQTACHKRVRVPTRV